MEDFEIECGCPNKEEIIKQLDNKEVEMLHDQTTYQRKLYLMLMQKFWLTSFILFWAYMGDRVNC